MLQSLQNSAQNLSRSHVTLMERQSVPQQQGRALWLWGKIWKVTKIDRETDAQTDREGTSGRVGISRSHRKTQRKVFFLSQPVEWVTSTVGCNNSQEVAPEGFSHCILLPRHTCSKRRGLQISRRPIEVSNGLHCPISSPSDLYVKSSISATVLTLIAGGERQRKKQDKENN